MNEITIERHSFDLAKKRLKTFSNNKKDDLKINDVRTEGGFLGLGDHKVTGTELNSRLESIQKNFIALNTINNKMNREFREVYNALDVLDKDYISSIVANVKAIEKTSNDVRTQQITLKQHNEKLSNQQSKLDAHQAEIEKNVANISKIVTALKVFKEKLEGYKHLTDIDKIWNDINRYHMEISSLSDSVSDGLILGQKNTDTIAAVKQSLADVDCNVSSIAKSLNEQINHIESIMLFIQKIKDTNHWNDIDKIWDSLERSHAILKNILDELACINQVVEKQQVNIDESLIYIETLSNYEHLEDIDNIWNTSEKHSGQINELQEQVEKSNKLIYQHKEVVAQSFYDEKERTDVLFKQLYKKIQYAYWLAGGSLTLAFIELIVILLW